MKLGMIGLGRMGANMALRLMNAGHDVHVYARDQEAIRRMKESGARGAPDIETLVRGLERPRTVWLMVPAGAVDALLQSITPLLEAGDTVVDGGNTFYRDDIRRAGELRAKGLHYIDVGVSGGVWGLERGYCLMIGGEAGPVERVDPLFLALAPGVGRAPRTQVQTAQPSQAEHGYLHCGPHGAGHFVKMIHNGIEYGLMAAFAEGFGVLRRANIGLAQNEVDAETTPLRNPEHYQYSFDLAAIAEVWRRGSVISSWLLDLAARSLQKGADLADFSGRVSDSGEGRWTLEAAIDEGVPAPVIATALFSRFSSRGNADYEDKLLSALRNDFGGHAEKAVA
jgi:6-phosphogluconate dehydrogenase